MGLVTAVFLVIGCVGISVLALAVLGGHVAVSLHLGYPDVAGQFSTPSIAGFIGTFGFAGAIAASLTPGNTAPVVVGAVVGVAAAGPVAVITARLSAAAMDMATDATPTTADLIGTTGVVVTPIPERGYGEVRVLFAGHQVKLAAMADTPLGMGVPVMVVEVPSSTSVVVEETPSIEEV